MTRTYSRLVAAVLFAYASVFAQAPPQRPQIQQQLTFAPDHAGGIYDVGETVGWTVTPGPDQPTYAYKWTVRRNNAVVLKEGKLDLSSGKARIEIAADQPEMLYVAVEPYASLATETPAPAAGSPATGYIGGNTGRNNGLYAVGAAVAPTKLTLSTPRPADFDAFWNQKLAEQAKIPINPALTPVETDVQGVELSMFVLDALGSKAHGYLAKPAKEGKFPALIQLQYAGVYALNARGDAQHAAEGWLVINVDSHDKLPSDSAGDIPKAYQAVGNTDREKSYFLNMYLRDSRALDYLLTRPDWDGKTIVVTGGSMGGQQSLILAGLRPEKITSALVCVPAGADTNGDLHGRKAGYPNWPSDKPDVMQTALYFDTANFASRIKAPVMAGFGFIDTTSPPAGVWTTLNQITSAVEPLPMIESEHDNLTPLKGRACPARTREILDVLVKGGTFNASPKVAQTASLRDLGEKSGIRIGTAVDPRALKNESAYAKTLAREFSQVEPENAAKFASIHPRQDTWNFDPVDALVSFAGENHMAVRGHTLVWHNQNPAWLTGGNFTPAQLAAILQDHIRTVVGRYAGRVYAWDVVNEAFNQDGTLRKTIWFDTPGIGMEGTAYIEQAFRWAHEADPKALLFYNDYGAEGMNAKSDAIYAMAKDFKSRGVPIDGIGLQMHLTANSPSVESMEANIRRITDLGLQVQYTELDVRIPVVAGQAGDESLATEARIYGDVVGLCVKFKLCTAIQTWGFTDAHSWIPGQYPGLGAGLEFDGQYQPKAAYRAMASALAAGRQ